MPVLRPAVFLDRDGTLNVEQSYITHPDQMNLLPGAASAIRLLRDAGFVCVVVTNQSGVGRGFMTQDDLDRVHEEMTNQLRALDAMVDAIYACPHPIDHPDRKPKPGMLLRAASDLSLDLARSWIIGDSTRDIEAGRAAGCLGFVLVRSGHPFDDGMIEAMRPTQVAVDVLAAAEYIVGRQAKTTSG